MTARPVPGRHQNDRPFQLSVQLEMLRLDGLTEVSDTPDSRHLLDLLGAEPGIATIESIRSRTEALAAHDRDLKAVPREQLILRRIVWPLRAAKQSYILGNYLGCIALCGTISEMLAVLRFEVSLHAKCSSGSQKRLYGSRFDRLGQSRRIDVLSELGLYVGEDVDLSRGIKEIRDRYLHALNVPVENIEADATSIYRATVLIVDSMVAVRGGLRPGTVAPGEHLIEFLKDRGTLTFVDESGLGDGIDITDKRRDQMPSVIALDPKLQPQRQDKEAPMQFRSDWATYVWDVKGVREQADLLDHPFIKVSYTGKYGMPIKGPSAFALRTALDLIEAGRTGQTIVSDVLVITIEGLEDPDNVSMLEGPGVGDPGQNTKLGQS